MLSKREVSRLKRAAEKIVLEKEDYACNAISKAYSHSPLRTKFTELMSPDEAQMPCESYTSGWYGFNNGFNPKSRLERSLSLLFFAEAGKDGK